ncbi:S8 family serine peptidase [Rossellomorea aquimaris]|uniref:S8 family serine peptidase n=1 Tax=Rossellomorea aquimaris TaxID=189382 RepID=UPI001CD42697|nr:S8 family serine peptidase [Rossellomorea aquimaris]MCA1058194.1 S8 family serine peptidase [Rossellomorea aquimaris]
MSGRKRKARWLSIILTLVMFVPLMFPFNAGAANTPQASLAKEKPSTSAKDSAKVSPQSKITSKLQDQFKKENHVTYLVKFKDQLDAEAVAEKASETAKKQKLSANSKKLLKRNMVVSELRAKALESQAQVKEYLAKEKKSGAVKEIKDFYVVNGMAVTSTKKVMEKISTFAEVEKILPNETRQIIQPAKTTSTAVLDKEAPNTPASIEWNIDRVGAPAVWDMGIDGAGTVIASIDTGVQWDHPALKEKYRGYDPQNPDSPDHEFNWFDATAGQSAPYDDQGHGTHTVGTMVGSEPDGSNQIGVAPGAKWIAVKAFTADGGTDVDLLEAGEWILAPKDAEGNPHPEMAPDVVNNSWGGGAGLDEWYRDMVTAWRAAEIFPEFSAGNTTLFNPGGPGSIANPANYPESFATGATDINDQLGSFSLQGPSPYDEVKPEIAAPGVNIRSSVPGGNYEGGWNGTSMAGPHVTAVAALLRQVDASLTVDELEEILMSTAVPLTDGTFPESPNNGYGHGLVNAFDAVSSVISGIGKVKGQVSKEGDDTEAPVISHEAPQEAFKEMNLPLQAEASDNVSVTNVALHYQNQDGEWVQVEATRTSGDYTTGTYESVIPGDELTGDQVTYKWTAMDFGGNEVESDTYTINLLPGISVGYEQDFESPAAGWTSYGPGNSWERGVPESGPGTATSGENVYATNLGGTYENSANMSLQMPPIDLPEGASFLQFKQWHELERNYDYGHVFVSTDGEEWTQALRVNGNTEGWIEGEVDLSQYAGQRVYVAFNVTTDGSVTKQGWYLDDVKLSAESILPAKKMNLGLKSKDEKSSSLSKKPSVNPDKITLKHAVKNDENAGQSAPVLLPLQAEVSVLETGRSVYTNPANGSYEMTHAAGEFTLQASTYGYRSETQRVTIEADQTSTANFTLEEIPQGNITGTVTNEITGEPVEGATVLVLEDAVVEPVATNADGEYELEAYEGDYTLKVVAPYYYSKEMSITVEGGEVTTADVALDPFIGYPGEIGYDDGTAENARAFYDAGNGWAVKMSLEEGNDTALVTGGLFRFWDTEWPVPGGTEFQVAVYDATGPDGAPGKKIAGPFNETALRNGEWTHVDLSQHGIMVEGDFYMVYIQSAPNPNAPGLGTDEDGEYAARSWQFVGGAWSPSPEDEGNYMIRATVNYEVTAPVITSPKDGSFTNKDSVTVEGTSAPTTTVHLFNGDEEVGTADTAEDGTFSLEVSLHEGENVLTAKAATEQGMTGPSDEITVILDQVKPELAITSPENDMKTNREAITVKGTVTDENLAWVKVNGEKASISGGEFSHRILLNEGENVIQVVAKDKAGNKKKQRVTVYAKFGDIEIENLLPREDKELKKGESVKIEFDSEPGLGATFVIQMPLTNAGQVTNANELPMMETSEGHYVGYYTATSNVKAPGAVIEVKIADDYGNVTTQRAEGKLYINTKK